MCKINNKDLGSRIVLIIIIGILFFIGKSFLSSINKNIENNNFDNDNLPENGNNLPIEDIDITGEYLNQFSFIEDCLIENTGDYKILNVFSGIQKSPLDSKDYYSYTKSYKIIGNIEDAKLCIVSDMVDYRKVHKYTYSTYILFNEPEYAGHLNVGYNVNKNIMYDKNSGGNQYLDGLFRGDETPKIYTLYDLSDIIVANTKDGGIKKINVLKRLQKEGQIRIGGFVNAKNGEGRINKFVLAYKCKTGNDCSIE